MIEEVSPTGKVRVFSEKKKKKETASVKPPEFAVKDEPKAKNVGGGWYETADGRKVRKSELEAGD